MSNPLTILAKDTVWKDCGLGNAAFMKIPGYWREAGLESSGLLDFVPKEGAPTADNLVAAGPTSALDGRLQQKPGI